MMEGYYESHPLLTLEKPVVIAGLVAQDTRLVGSRVASLTGLPFVDIDRAVEHETAQSLWKMVQIEGEGEYRRVEQTQLRKALAGTPYGVIVIGDGALMEKENLTTVLARAALIALDLDLPSCYWRLRSISSSRSAPWHPLFPQPLVCLSQLEPFYQERQPALEQAHLRIDMRGQQAGRAVNEILEFLPQLSLPTAP